MHRHKWKAVKLDYYNVTSPYDFLKRYIQQVIELLKEKE